VPADDRLVEAGRQIIARFGRRASSDAYGRDRYADPGPSEDEMMSAALQENGPYIMAADQWERDGWVQGAARYAQQQDLSDMAGERETQRVELARQMREALMPYAQLPRMLADSRAESLAEQAAVRDARVLPPQDPAGGGGTGWQTVAGGAIPVYEAPRPGPDAGTSARWSEVMAGAAARAATLDDVARMDRRVDKVFGHPGDDVVAPPGGGFVSPEILAAAAAAAAVPPVGPDRGYVGVAADRIGGLDREALAAELDPNRYAREYAPYLGIAPMLAEGLYPSEPTTQVRDFNAGSALNNILMTGDAAGLGPQQRQMQATVDQLSLGDAYADATGMASVVDDPLTTNIAAATGIDQRVVAAAVNEPLWGSYQSEVEQIAVDMPDATWGEIKTTFDELGLPMPKGELEQVLAAYWRAASPGE